MAKFKVKAAGDGKAGFWAMIVTPHGETNKKAFLSTVKLKKQDDTIEVDDELVDSIEWSL